MSKWVPCETVEEVLAKAADFLPFEPDRGQVAYIAKVCADRRVEKVWIAGYDSESGTITLRWNMRWRARRALAYYSHEKHKTLTRREPLPETDKLREARALRIAWEWASEPGLLGRYDAEWCGRKLTLKLPRGGRWFLFVNDEQIGPVGRSPSEAKKQATAYAHENLRHEDRSGVT